MRSFVTGGAGFIGSNLVDALLAAGDNVVAYDNLSTGQMEFLDGARKEKRFEFVEGDILDDKSLTAAMACSDRVFHLAANADVRFGLNHPRRDLEQNTIGTFNVLEAMRTNNVRSIAFASTGSVYGEASVFPTPEDAPMPVQTSLYAASKLACEGLISSYAEGYGFHAQIFRFVSILGPRYTHGHIFDFYRQLEMDPTKLRVLGDGSQRKSYLAVEDCIAALLLVGNQALDGSEQKHKRKTPTDGSVQIFNLGSEEYCRVLDSIGWITAALGVTPELLMTGGNRGWIGDSPFIFLETKRIRERSWSNQSSIQQGVERTVAWLKENPWIFQKRV